MAATDMTSRSPRREERRTYPSVRCALLRHDRITGDIGRRHGSTVTVTEEPR